MNNPKEVYQDQVDNIKKRQPLMAWLLSLLLIIMGYYLSEIRFLGIEWLTRSGCLIVLIGVWSSIGAITAERLLISKLNLVHRIELSREKRKLKKSHATKEFIAQEVDTIEEAFDDEIEVVKDDVRYQFGLLEVSLLMTGTFLWGFGDLIFKINI